VTVEGVGHLPSRSDGGGQPGAKDPAATIQSVEIFTRVIAVPELIDIHSWPWY
jgi:hypothetical protein